MSTFILPRPPLFPPGIAFVAGGSGGVGSAICRALADAGCDVFLTYRRNGAKAAEVADDICAMGRQAHVLQLDLASAPAVVSALSQAEDATNHGVHTVVYASGPHVPLKFLSRVTPDEFKEFILGDTVCGFNLAHAAIPLLRKTRGSLVAITTTVLERWASQDGLSGVPKGALERLWAGIAREEGRYGVRANSVALGVIDAGILTKAVALGQMGDKYFEAMRRNVPLQRRGTAEEAADGVVFLASSRASYTTGQVLHVDGGFAI